MAVLGHNDSKFRDVNMIRYCPVTTSLHSDLAIDLSELVSERRLGRQASLGEASHLLTCSLLIVLG